MHCAVPFFLCPKRNGRRGSVSLRGMLRAACGRGSGLRGRASALRGGGSARRGRVAVRERAEVFGGEWVVRSAGVHRAACGRASGLRGRAEVFGGEWVVRAAGNASHSLRACVGAAWACVGAAWGSGSAREGRVAVRGRAKGFGGEWVVRAARNASSRGGGAEVFGEGAEVLGEGVGAAWGRAEVFGGEWVVRSASLTHIRRCSTRARVLLYIRPPCPRREIAAMGPKDAFCEYPSPAKAFAPAPSAFALPRPRSHFPRPRSHFPRRAIGIPRIAIGISQQQLSTMGYPRKSYPHCCSPPCAKRSRPRACARGYIIYRSPVGCSREESASLRKRVRAFVTPCPAPPCAGWGRAKAKADAPSRSAEPCRLCAESLCAKAEVHKANPAPVRALSPRQPAYGRAPARLCAESLCTKTEVRQTNPAPARAFFPRQLVYRRAPARLWPNHCAQRRKCTRQSPALPVRSSRAGLSTAVLPPADGRALCVLPASARLRPRPCPLMGEVPSAGWRSAQGKGGLPLAQYPALSPPTVPYLPAYGRAPSRSAPPPPPKWAPRLRRREGKRPNGAPPHRNAHTPNAERKRYLHNSRTMTQRRTKRCAQFVIFVFTPCKLLHNFSTVLHRSPRDVPKRAQIAARRPDFPCFTARFSPLSPESHRAKHPRTAPVLPPKNAPLRAYAKPRPHSRVRGTRQHATTCAFFTFSARYEQGGGARNANFCPAEGRKWGRFRSQMLKKRPSNEEKHVFIWTISNLTNTFAP